MHQVIFEAMFGFLLAVLLVGTPIAIISAILIPKKSKEDLRREILKNNPRYK